jgi:hypothetical protein
MLPIGGGPLTMDFGPLTNNKNNLFTAEREVSQHIRGAVSALIYLHG